MNKEKIYLLPGLMTDERLWSRLKPFLENEYELIHLELPLTTNFDEAVEELNRKIAEDKINLLGFSLGGYVAAYFSIKYPQKVNRLMLVAATPSCMNQDEIEKRKLTLKQMDNLGFKGLSYKKTQSLLEESNQNDEELIYIVQDMFSSLGKEVYNIQMESTFKRKDIYKELVLLKIPIKFFYSLNDRLLNHKSLKKIKDEHKNIEKISRVGTSHMIPLETPKKLTTIIKSWMSLG